MDGAFWRFGNESGRHQYRGRIRDSVRLHVFPRRLTPQQSKGHHIMNKSLAFAAISFAIASSAMACDLNSGDGTCMSGGLVDKSQNNNFNTTHNTQGQSIGNIGSGTDSSRRITAAYAAGSYTPGVVQPVPQAHDASSCMVAGNARLGLFWGMFETSSPQIVVSLQCLSAKGIPYQHVIDAHGNFINPPSRYTAY